jgi:hypothetical protein
MMTGRIEEVSQGMSGKKETESTKEQVKEADSKPAGEPGEGKPKRRVKERVV